MDAAAARAVLLALESAKEQIFIADWWLSPDLHLVRPPDDRTRLDHVLQRAAERGVQIFVCLYKDVEIALPINRHA